VGVVDHLAARASFEVGAWGDVWSVGELFEGGGGGGLLAGTSGTRGESQKGQEQHRNDK